MRIADFIAQEQSKQNEYLQRLRPTKAVKRRATKWVANVSASIGGEPHLLRGRALNERMRAHAFARLQIATVVGAAFEAASLSAVPRQLPTLYQSGKGCGPLGEFDAAHACLVPRVTDDGRERLILRIHEEGLTRRDCKILKVKGMRDRGLAAIRRSLGDLERLKALIASFWKEGSLFASSWLERRVMAVCHQVPIKVNREIDLRLERGLRERAIQSYQGISEGRCTAFTATKSLAKLLRSECTVCVRAANERLGACFRLKRVYVKTLRSIKAYKVDKKESSRERVFKDLESYREVIFSAFTFLKGAPEPKLYRHIELYEDLLDLPENLAQMKDSGITERVCELYIQRVLKDVDTDIGTSELDGEIDASISWYHDYIRHCNLQREASCFTREDYLGLYGKKGRGAKRVELSQDEFVSEALRGLQHFSQLDT